MSTITPNMSIFIPAPGQELYGPSFQAGMLHVDQHDHSGAPNNGVPIQSAGLADGAVTAVKLNDDVIAPGGGLEFNGDHQLFVNGEFTVDLVPGGGLAFNGDGALEFDPAILSTLAASTELQVYRNLTVERSSTDVIFLHAVQNTINNPAAQACVESRVAGVSGTVQGDAWMACVGNFDWSWGEDASTPGSPVFRFGHGGSPSTMTAFYSIDTSGIIRVLENDFSVQRVNAGVAVAINIFNQDNTNAASSAALVVQTGGSSGGDALAIFGYSASHDWALGMDISDSESFKISRSNGLGTNDCLDIEPGGLISIPLGDISVARSEISGLVKISLRNLDNTNSDSSARLEIIAGNTGGTTGDAYILFSNLSVPFNYEFGQDTVDNSLIITIDSNSTIEQISGTTAFRLDSSGNITLQASNSNILSLNNVTQAGVGAVSLYMQVVVNGTDYVIPLYLRS